MRAPLPRARARPSFYQCVASTMLTLPWPPVNIPCALQLSFHRLGVCPCGSQVGVIILLLELLPLLLLFKVVCHHRFLLALGSLLALSCWCPLPLLRQLHHNLSLIILPYKVSQRLATVQLLARPPHDCRLWVDDILPL